MKAINDITINVRAIGIATTLAVLVVALLAVALATSPTMAQTPTPVPTPQPCGPGQPDAPDNPDATITQGHYAVFDGYWDSSSETLNLNLCPPAVERRDVPNPNPREGGTIEVSTRHNSNIDIRRTVFHIDHVDGVAADEQFKHTLTAAEVEEYDFLKLGDGPDAGTVDDAVGTTVWWLKVDDESTSDVDEDSPLAMGFSAALFESQHWYREEGGVEVEPLQYEFEAIRQPGTAVAERGTFFVFDDSVPAAGQDKTAEWEGKSPDTNALAMYPGDYHHFQWIFTKPGAYEISVQLKGHVRQNNPHAPDHKDYDSTWERISDDDVVTSEVVKYTFHVGPLPVNADPSLRLEFSVDENALPGAAVGDLGPLVAHDPDGDTVSRALAGAQSHKFVLDGQGRITRSHCGDGLDYETRSAYPLTIDISDGKDAYGVADAFIDDAIEAVVNVNDVSDEGSNPNAFAVALEANRADLALDINETLILTAVPRNVPDCSASLSYRWAVHDPVRDTWTSTTGGHVKEFRNTDTPGTFQYRATSFYRTGDDAVVQATSPTTSVAWRPVSGQ